MTSRGGRGTSVLLSMDRLGLVYREMREVSSERETKTTKDRDGGLELDFKNWNESKKQVGRGIGGLEKRRTRRLGIELY